ncbi:MAG: reverse transcriptase domain-containing protein, partial [Myxococcota bacterium]
HRQSPRGTPQGGVASPLLSNLYLDTIDHFVAQTFSREEVRWVRYADDALLMCRRNVRGVYAAVKTKIEALGLTVNAEKTKRTDVRETGFDFLGFHFAWRESLLNRGRFYSYIFPARPSEVRLREKVRKKTSQRAPIPPEEFVAQINEIIRGWAEYYRHTSASKSFHTAQRFVNRRVRSYLMKRGKRRGRGYRPYPDGYLYQKLGLINLTAKGWVRCAH